MGLGGTLRPWRICLSEKIARRLDRRPCMVVMPTSLIPNWLDEAAHFTPQLRVLAPVRRHPQKRFANLQDYDLLLTTYALLPKDIDQLAALPLHVLILDEAQYIKNPLPSKAAQAARRAERTAAPVPERHPAWKTTWASCGTLFHFLLPGWLGDVKSFNPRLPRAD